LPQGQPGRGEWPAWLDEDDFDGLGEEVWRAAMESLAEEGPTPIDLPEGEDFTGGHIAGGAGLTGRAGLTNSVGHTGSEGFARGESRDDRYCDGGSWDGGDGLPVLGFGLGEAGELMPPGVSLGMLAEHAITSGGLAVMPDDAVVGLIGAARRLRCRAEWLELQGTREFARRRWESDLTPVRDEDGRWVFRNSIAEQAPDELAFHLSDGRVHAGERMELSLALRDRLPRMDALLAAGHLDERRVAGVRDVTIGLTDEQARRVDELLAPDAAGLPYTALRRRAAKLAMSLSPEAESKRKERATRRKARVEKFPERSGNYALAVREMPVEEILASEQHIRGLAGYLRRHGVQLGQREAEVMVYLDLTQGRDPLDRIPPDRRDHSGATSGRPQGPSGTPGEPGPGSHDWRDDEDPHDDESWRDGPGDDWDEDDWDEDDEDDDGNSGDGNGGGGPGPWPFSPSGPGRPGGRAPFAATINLLVPVGTAFGWSTMPGEADRDIIDPQTLRDMMQAASRHPETRWCVTLVGEDGTAVGHGCARGRHTWDPPPGADGNTAADSTTNNTSATGRAEDIARPPAPGQQPTLAQAAALAKFLARLKITVEPIAKGSCDHRHAEPRYRPGKKLGHLTRARNATCPAPGCGANSWHSDMDHTEPWPDGPTCECNLGLPCRHHHRTKQAPGWKLEQPAPGVFRWTTPSGRTYETRRTRYDL
jgi:hypothetical protein